MLSDFKSQTIVWDKANRQIFEKIEGHQGDTNGRQLVVQVLDDGTIAQNGLPLLYAESGSNQYGSYLKLGDGFWKMEVKELRQLGKLR